MKKLLTLAAVAAAVMSCGNKTAQKTCCEDSADAAYVDTVAENHPEYLPEIAVDTIAPDFCARDTAGTEIRLSDYKGKYVVLDFWASWCGDCRAEVPELKKVFGEFKDTKINGSDVQFLSYSFDREEQAWKDFLKKEAFEWPQVSTLEPKWHDNVAAKGYGLHWIPAFILVSPEGKVAGKAISAKGLRQLMKDEMK